MKIIIIIRTKIKNELKVENTIKQQYDADWHSIQFNSIYLRKTTTNKLKPNLSNITPDKKAWHALIDALINTMLKTKPTNIKLKHETLNELKSTGFT